MNLMGKYRVQITDKNGNKRFYETKNHIVNNGIRQVLDWLAFDLYSPNAFQGLKKISADEMYFPENTVETATSMDYAESIMDYDNIDNSEYYYDKDNNTDLKNYMDYDARKNNTYATIDKYRDGTGEWNGERGWNEQSITLFFKENAILLSAINLDAQMFCSPNVNNNENIAFEIKYRDIDQITWKHLPCNYTLTKDNIRRNLTFFVCPNVPPFVFLPCTGLKLTFRVKKNTLSDENNLVGKIYNVSLFKAHHIAQPPAVMKFGTGTTPASNEQTNLENFVYSQVVNYITRPDEKENTVSYVVEIPRDKCNNVDISEIGMFYRYDYVNPTHQHVKQTVKNANEIFSRALFTDENGKAVSWKKTEYDEIVIAYDITVGNEYQNEETTQSQGYLF